MWELLLKNKKFKISLGVIISIVAFALIGPIVTRDPTRRYSLPYQPPSFEFILGTDKLGEDMFARLCVGTRTSLMIGIFAGSISILLAIFFGGLGPYRGGLMDTYCNFFTNIMLVFPMIPLLVIFAAWLEQRSLLLVGFLIGVTGWPWAARATRAQILSLKEREFVNLARISGMKTRTVLIREIFPNLLAYIATLFVYAIGGTIMAEAAISMIGLGPTDVVSLGNLLYWALLNETFRLGYWWAYLPPGIILTAFMVAAFTMHAGMDEVFNPRLRKM
jgi:peptide/nickel transport system permease protein